MTLGQGVIGNGPDLLHSPNDVVIDPEDGDVFVVDSHRRGMNNRIVHYTAEGEFIKEWGKQGITERSTKRNRTRLLWIQKVGCLLRQRK